MTAGEVHCASLTAAGEQFPRYATDVTQAMDAAAAALSGAAQAAPVRVGALPLLGGPRRGRWFRRARGGRPGELAEALMGILRDLA